MNNILRALERELNDSEEDQFLIARDAGLRTAEAFGLKHDDLSEDQLAELGTLVIDHFVKAELLEKP